MTEAVGGSEPEIMQQEARKRRIEELFESMDSPKQAAKAPRLGLTTKRAKQASAYNPRSRQQLLDRLATYKLYKYQSIASPISAISLARKGWKLDQRLEEQTRLVCVCCKASLVFLLGRKEPSTALLARYAQMSQTSHADGCPWIKNGCRLELVQLQLDSTKESLAAYEYRSRSFTTEHTFNLSDSALEQTSRCESPPMLMALFGWQADMSTEELCTVHCQDCLRRAVLRKDISFDIEREHFDFCPWINPASQGKQAGWLDLLQLLEKRQQNDTHAEAEAAKTAEPKEIISRLKRLKQQLGLKMRVAET